MEGREGDAGVRRDGWLALLLIKAGDVETNPGPTITHKQAWICDTDCHEQILGKQQGGRGGGGEEKKNTHYFSGPRVYKTK